MKELLEASLAEYSYKRGQEDERSRWTGYLQPQTIEMTIRVRGESDDVNTVRQVVTFEEMKVSRAKVLRLYAEELVAKIATAGVIKSLIERL